MLVGELECLDQPQGLVYVPPDGQVVDGHLAELLVAVDDEQAAEGEAGIFLRK